MIQELGKGKARLIVNIGSGQSRRRVSKTVTYSTKRELKRMYDAFAEEAGSQTPTLNVTVGELIDSHIEHLASLGRKSTTIRGYRIVEKRFDSRFKAIKAKDLTTYHIEREIARMGKCGLSAKTIKNSIGFLSAVYEHAIYIKQLTENPCKYAVLPSSEKKDVRILHRDEIQPFLNGIADAPLDDKVAYELALFMGLRRSEILGLKESDIDLVQGVLFVHNTRHNVNGETVNQDTKTVQSRRVLAMPELVMLDIARLLQAHQNFKYEKVDYLIQDGFGNIIHPQTLASRLTRLERKKGLPHVTLHGLRHTYASLLHSAGVEMARISRELGHSNLTTTSNLYTHIFEEASASSRGIASTIDALPEVSRK